MSDKRCECGERLTGHEDESPTKCRWCVAGWLPLSKHTTTPDCWCQPTLDFVSEDGVAVYTHHKPN